MKKIELFSLITSYCTTIHNDPKTKKLRRQYPFAVTNNRHFLEPFIHYDRGSSISVSIGTTVLTFGLTGKRNIFEEIKKTFEKRVGSFLATQAVLERI